MYDVQPQHQPHAPAAAEDPGPAPRTRRGCDALVDALVAGGVTTLFGVPGDTGVALYDALYERADDIRHILARDERHAASMADAYARSGNRVGVVEVSSGGGTTYVVGGLGEAYAAGVPVLLITSDIHAASRGTGALTEIDQVALFSAVTKWTRVAESADDLPELVARALREAVSGRPAPVALIVPENVLDAPTRARPAPDAAAPALPARRPGAPAAAVAEAARLLSRARRPAVLAGSGVHVSGAWRSLEELAATVGAAVATSIHGKGAVGGDCPWSVGVVGNNGALPGANALLREADTVLLVGTRANATDTNSWTGPARGGVPVIQIDIDPGRAGRNFPGAIALPGDADTVLRQLLAEVIPVDDSERALRLTAVRAAAQTPAPAARPVEPAPGDGPRLLPDEVVRVVCAGLPAGTPVIADPGTPTPNVAAYWKQREAGREVIVPRGHGPMGYAIPAAVGVAMARPGTPLVSFTADGSFAMACGELETVSRLEVPVLFVQFTNHSLGWIKMLQHLYSGRRYFGVDPGTIDAVAVARACGVEAHTVGSTAELQERVADFAERPRPVYLDVEVPHMIDYTPPVPAWDRGPAGNAERPVY
ncbi:thiamine pyrophosphate-binding protein [Streptomyces paludis]|uniref:thiamine pyrophosphate-binding protein n=1 Tax=Streptomyces paludis TaxID=2282738 RepID=UPI0013B468F8|nr:thiamine pyrophosphate-binding protein [Streptomyces paludis]